jgi:hypothetical protein
VSNANVLQVFFTACGLMFVWEHPEVAAMIFLIYFVVRTVVVIYDVSQKRRGLR